LLISRKSNCPAAQHQVICNRRAVVSLRRE
jgi:hypothetical protein